MNVLGRSLACLALVSAVSCSATSPAAASHPRPGPMPAGASWRGFYQGPYHIMLNIWAQGERARGNWRALGDREGMFTGHVSGNLLEIDWSEHALSGGAAWSGTGYFVYSAGQSGKPDQIFGEWSMGQAGAASSWWAVKRAGDPLGGENGQIDSDADQQYQDDETGCDVGNCDNDTGL
ncbi:MAG TPA: hypothetical protein VHB79_25710 [Polyangiaceae bacterium]|nr:hypothetical protein [Polyangiaceae bacterium]